MTQGFLDPMGDVLLKLGEYLDISDELFEKATTNYKDVSNWLASIDSELYELSPDVYVQGSFRLGTIIKPMTTDGEYDIDLVCNLSLTKDQITQTQLKNRIGNRLKKRPDLAKILTESRRCWTLDFPGQFHMDVLPAIPNPERPPTGIQLTDTDLRNWQKSNPRAYADWFYARMAQASIQKRSKLAAILQLTIENVPEWKVRTPLQRIVQVLKRHRDIHFSNIPENKPASIVITTLAAMAYEDQTDLTVAFADVIPKMSMLVEKRNEKWWIQNPVDPEENFADKWNDHPERKIAFDRWIQKVTTDLIDLPTQLPMRESMARLAGVMGQETIRKVAASLGLDNKGSTSSFTTPLRPSWIPQNEDISHVLPPKWPVSLCYKVSVEASVHPSRGGKFLARLRDALVPRQHYVKFTAITDTPGSFFIEWQVVNTGHEARGAKKLRGDFYPGEAQNGSLRWEPTQYVGIHWVEAFVIQDGVCVARSGPVAVPIGGPEKGANQFRSVAR